MWGGERFPIQHVLLYYSWKVVSAVGSGLVGEISGREMDVFVGYQERLGLSPLY